MSDDAADPAETLFLFDGSALIYRAHFAFARSGLSSASGTPTGATFGFSSDVHRILTRERPTYAVMVLDTAAKTFRHEMFDAYKATRQKMPEELVEQLPLVDRASTALGLDVLKKDGYEADDLIATLAKKAANDGIRCFIVTGDKDFMQIVTEDIKLYNVMKKDQDVLLVGPAEVVEKFGIPPELVIDMLALMGDSSDNVPGVKGIGEKTAKNLLLEYGSLDKVLSAAPTMKAGKVQKALIEHGDDALLSRRLVTIDTEAPVTYDLEALRYHGPRRDLARELFRELNFRTLYTEMAEESESPATIATNYRFVKSAEELHVLAKELMTKELVAVDTETTGLDPLDAAVVGLSFSHTQGEAVYVPLIQGTPAGNLFPLDDTDPLLPEVEGGRRGQAILEVLRPFLESDATTKCGQNIKYDALALRKYGITIRGLRTDTLIASYLLEPEERERGLDALARRHFDHVKIPTSNLIGKGKNEITMDQVPVEQVSQYACEDADFTLRLAERFLPRLDEEGLRSLHDDVELPLIEVLTSMQELGIRVDQRLFKKMAASLEEHATRVEAEVYALAENRRFNINSPKQLGEVLFDDLKVHEQCQFKPKKTKTGWATGQEILEALSSHPLPAKILEYRSVTKLLNTYVVPLPGLVNAKTQRIHTTFNQTGAATGRLSSQDPNLQNIPIRSDLGRPIRAAFLATDEDHVLLSADYSQIELRIMAHLAEDPALIEAFKAGADIHRDTAARVFNVPADQVDSTLRSRAKAINFGVMYGMGPQRLARQTNLDLDEAKAFIERYFTTFPAVRGFIEKCKDDALRDGYVKTLLGRRRPLPDIRSTNGRIRSQAENMAVNTPIQGTAADFIKLAMVNIHRRLLREKLQARMVLTVHDELVLDVPKAELDHVLALVVDEMSGVHPLLVPLKVDTGYGKDWLEAH